MLYLKGINGDNIAYVAQASNKLVMTARGCKDVMGEISKTNFGHTEDILYVEVKNYRKFLEVFRIPEKRCERQVEVKFDLKHHYFYNLKNFVNALSNNTILRLLPMSFAEYNNKAIDECYEVLNLHCCSEDQYSALVKVVSCPDGCPPILVTGPFGTGKTRILALAAHYFLQNITAPTSILVCTQQHSSADAFLEYALNLCIPMPEKIYIARVRDGNRTMRRDKGAYDQRYLRTHPEFEDDFIRNPPTLKCPYLIVTTCQGAHKLKKGILRDFHFTHIFVDEVGNMREAEAVAPLCLANNATKIVLAGDKEQVSCHRSLSPTTIFECMLILLV